MHGASPPSRATTTRSTVRCCRPARRAAASRSSTELDVRRRAARAARRASARDAERLTRWSTRLRRPGAARRGADGHRRPHRRARRATPSYDVEVTADRPDGPVPVLWPPPSSAPPRTAYVFPGQGIQAQGMGMDGYARSAAAKAVWDARTRSPASTWGSRSSRSSGRTRPRSSTPTDGLPPPRRGAAPDAVHPGRDGGAGLGPGGRDARAGRVRRRRRCRRALRRRVQRAGRRVGRAARSKRSSSWSSRAAWPCTSWSRATRTATPTTAWAWSARTWPGMSHAEAEELVAAVRDRAGPAPRDRQLQPARQAVRRRRDGGALDRARVRRWPSGRSPGRSRPFLLVPGIDVPFHSARAARRRRRVPLAPGGRAARADRPRRAGRSVRPEPGIRGRSRSTGSTSRRSRS